MQNQIDELMMAALAGNKSACQCDELLVALKLAHKELTRSKNVMLIETGNGVVDMNVLWKTERAIQKAEGK